MNHLKRCLSIELFKMHPSIPLSGRKYCIKSEEYKERKIKVDDVEINYLKVGTGSCNIILMPGALGSIWTDFEPQIKGLSKALFTIVAWDPPGYGKSIPPVRDYPANFFERDADYAIHLMRALDLPKFSPLGWSDGGISSLILAAKHPINIEKLVVWGANSHIKPTELKIYEGLRDLSKWSNKMKLPFVGLYGEKYFEETWNKWCDGMKNIYEENRGDICMECLTKIECPTFIVHGEKDPMIHKEHFPILHSNIRNITKHVYADGKHNIHLKYAEDFNRRVTEFLLL